MEERGELRQLRLQNTVNYKHSAREKIMNTNQTPSNRV